MEMYRVTTHGESFRTGRPTKRVEILQKRWAAAYRIADANNVAAYCFTQGRENTHFVLVDEMVNGEWEPVDGKFWTGELTYESLARWAERHGGEYPEGMKHLKPNHREV